MLSKSKYYLPLLAAELYLFITLLIFFFGPVEYKIHNNFYFFFYIFLYHLFTCLGYWLGAKLRIVNKKSKADHALPPFSFTLISILALVSALISNANLAMTNSIIPTNIISIFISGISFESIGAAYFEKLLTAESYGGNKILNIVFFFLAWPKIVYVPYIVYQWDKFNLGRKLLSIFIALLPVLSGISTGTNKPVFDFVMLFISSLAIFFIANRLRNGQYRFKSRLLFLKVSIAGLCLAIVFFSNAMKGRNVDFDFLESTSSLSDIKVDKDLNSENAIGSGLIWLSTYIVQGYYGFSLALSKDFTTTFGVGNSPFLSRQFEWLTGIDIHTRTYQYKINNYWGETEQWHSFYSHMANDFHFLGVAVVLFVIGFLMAITWKAIVKYHNYYALLLLPLYFVMFVFMPANNQVFGFIETLSTYMIFNFLMFRTISFK